MYGPEGRSPWLDVTWSEHLSWLRGGDAVMNVCELGDGPPIVWVHGLGGAWQNWLEQLPEFGRDHRCVAMDLPGFGASPMPEEDLSIPAYGRAVAALLDALGIERAVVVGNSMGGFIATELAIQFPERVEKLVLVSAAGISSESLRRRPLLTGAKFARYGATWVGSKADWVVRRPRMRLAFAGSVMLRPDKLPPALVEEQVRGSGKPGFIDAFDALMSYQIRERIGEIRCPTLIVWGRQDRLVPVKDADVFAELIPDARKVIFERTGHVPQLERPAKFNETLREFLADADRPPERV